MASNANRDGTGYPDFRFWQSAYVRAADRDEALRAGYEEYLVKPVGPERLVEIVAALASARSEQRRLHG